MTCKKKRKKEKFMIKRQPEHPQMLALHFLVAHFIQGEGEGNFEFPSGFPYEH